MDKYNLQTIKLKEKVFLVVSRYKEDKNNWPLKDMRDEMVELAHASSAEVVGDLCFHISKPSATNFIGDGKLLEIKNILETVDTDTVIFSHDLKGSQQRNIENALKVKTIDRTQLILDIFAKHATSKEGKIQVELAQLEYLLPRLVGHGIELSRLGGGIGTLGPGETKLELDRRRISQKIGKLKKELKEVVANRALKRKKRKDKKVPMISLVGYTNAGKSTLLNALTNAKQKTQDGLFTTLDSLTRQCELPNHQKVVISDTVGFMNDLPHHLIESFKATLEEVQQADLLLHVVDLSAFNFRELVVSVNTVLKELSALDKPTIIVFNKIDKLEDEQLRDKITGSYKHSVCVSALKNEQMDHLFKKIEELLSDLYTEINTTIPIDRMDLVNLAHEQGEVISIKYYSDSINIRAALPKHLAAYFMEKPTK